MSTPEHVHFAGYDRRRLAAALPHLRDVASGQGVPGGDHADLSGARLDRGERSASQGCPGTRRRRVGRVDPSHRSRRPRGRGRALTALRACQPSPFVLDQGAGGSPTSDSSTGCFAGFPTWSRAAAARTTTASASTTRTTFREPTRAAGGTSRSPCAETAAGARPMHLGGGRRARPRVKAVAGGLRASGAAGEAGGDELALRVLLQELRRGHGGGRPDPDRHAGRWFVERRGWAEARASLKNSLPFMPAASVRPGMVMFTADGSLRRRRERRAGEHRPAGLRPRRRGHAQLRRQRADHPQLDLRLPRRRHHATSSTSRTTTRTPRSSSSSRTTARRRRSSAPPTR